jgi:hypothetical protein
MSLQAAIPNDKSDLLPHNNSISAAQITTLAHFLTSDQTKNSNRATTTTNQAEAFLIQLQAHPACQL